ncbi:ABC transporter substrate-binding protein [Paracidovorax konjaci]|uniref:Amino acid ABC transporter substrate-binding protein, PAAT family n=1 Tax=Paracidovorax konjaci TaxID=32040 RepID=A0A1I1V9N1_9BURK|nr:ABC transporter substrate-binding protein [Paracidovorax konjaci]SFD79732.1 amino acid ABC transporter substrate-binding protein, PAAT family [Paracidovorax konjaci]
MIRIQLQKLPRNAVLLAALAAVSTLSWADRLGDIKKAGVVRVAAFDANPPFGQVDPKTRKIVGLDVDVAAELAKALGVKLEIVPTNPANRIPLLTSGKVDLVLANFTITEERAKVVNFSTPYFASGTQFIAKKGTLKSPDQLNALRIGVDKGTTNEIQLRQKYPQATLVAYDDTPFAFAALRNGNVQAISQDGPKLIGLLSTVPDRDKYEIPPFAISQDYIGVGIPKGETALTDTVNTALRAIEADGRAQKIHDAWFGPSTATPLQRIFKIGDPS